MQKETLSNSNISLNNKKPKIQINDKTYSTNIDSNSQKYDSNSNNNSENNQNLSNKNLQNKKNKLINLNNSQIEKNYNKK